MSCSSRPRRSSWFTPENSIVPAKPGKVPHGCAEHGSLGHDTGDVGCAPTAFGQIQIAVISLAGLYGQAESELLREVPAIGAGGEHDRVRLQHISVRESHPLDSASTAENLRHPLPRLKSSPVPSSTIGKLEDEAIWIARSRIGESGHPR